jgi:hypothetical protein
MSIISHTKCWCWTDVSMQHVALVQLHGCFHFVVQASGACFNFPPSYDLSLMGLTPDRFDADFEVVVLYLI